jgi:hypothetical protein
MFAYVLKSINVETNDNSDLNIHTSWWRQASRPRDALRETFRLELPCNTETVSVFACQSRDCIQLSKTLKTTTSLVWHPTILQQEIHEYLEQFLLSEADSRSARQESPPPQTHGTWRSSTVFTTICHWTQSLSRWIQFPHSHYTSLNFYIHSNMPSTFMSPKWSTSFTFSDC